MNKLKIIKNSLLILILVFGNIAHGETIKKKYKEENSKSFEKIYREAQREFGRKNYPEAIKLFEKFISKNKTAKTKYIKSRVFWSIDLVVRTHLRVYKDADAALSFLKKMNSIPNLSDAEDDIIQEWTSVAKEWKKLGRLPQNIKDKEDLFRLGEKYYKKGMDKIDYPADDTGNADFYIAATYLVPYVYNYDNSKNIGKALFMLGNIRFRSWNDYEYWTENYYLKEVIRRFPHSDLAKRAYKSLKEGVKAGYTGSGGDFTPPSQIKMLEVYKKLSEPMKSKKPLIY